MAARGREEWALQWREPVHWEAYASIKGSLECAGNRGWRGRPLPLMVTDNQIRSIRRVDSDGWLVLLEWIRIDVYV